MLEKNLLHSKHAREKMHNFLLLLSGNRFVRCADLKSSETGLDISPAARFHQSTMYWQHPHVPWLTMFPRMSKANIGCSIGEAERTALARDWSDSFRSLFQVKTFLSIFWLEKIQ